MIPLFNPSLDYKEIKDEIDEALKRVLNKGNYILGEEVRNFEQEFASFLGIKYAVGVASGTDALKIAIKALGLGSSDEVILPANVYPTAFAVAESGVKIKLVDVDPKTFNIDETKIDKVISKKTKAVAIVHLYGQPVDLEPILKITRRHKLWVIEDCAQAHGAQYQNRKVGTIGDIGCFSFYPTKPLGAFGDGGMIVTDKPKIYERVRLLRMYGEEKRYQSLKLGFNSRLDEIQAAVLRVKLRYLDSWNNKRRLRAREYLKLLSPVGAIKLPQNKPGHVYHLFVLQTPLRNKLGVWLEKLGIITGVHYPLPIHLVKSFSFLGYKKGDFPIAEKLSREILSLPLYSQITAPEIKKICLAIKKFYATKKS